MSTAMFTTTRDNLVENIPTFRRYKIPFTTYTIPEIRQNRRLTDIPFFILLIICIVALLFLFIYTSLWADIFRIINGYDYCGNVCGKKNTHVDDIKCSGIDMTDRPYLQYTVDPTAFDSEYVEFLREKCVERCDQEHIEGFHRCYPKRYYNDNSDLIPSLIGAIDDHYSQLISLCFIGLGFAVLEILLFRYFTKAFIQSIMITTILFFLSLSILFWYFYAGPLFHHKPTIYLSLAITFTILTLIVSLIILVMLPRISLITLLFEETIKLMFTMPLIVFVPLFTFIVNAAIVALFIYSLLISLSSGTLEQVDGRLDYYDYSSSVMWQITIYFSIVMLVWLFQLVYAGQHVIISGAISAGYFASDPMALESPIFYSFYNLIKFHLGSVAFGSLLITSIQIIKWILTPLTRGRYRRFGGCCVDCLESIFKYFTSLGYIEIAIHGQSLCRSSVRGLTLIITNFLSAFVVNSISDFIIMMAQILIIAGTVGMGLLMHDSSDYYWILIVLSVFYTFIFSHAFFVAFKISLDTVFICFCEDQLMNDGVNSPYFTTMNFYTYMINAQKYEIDKQDSLKQKKWK